ncbi:MAG: TIGR01777 family oxidoreductase [Acidobacteria bacterium]|nr:TIGR01777 family oxidoreductase [Acidobacteriota bacterium]
MRVFITGATGFIGRALVPRLQREGYSVLAWVRSDASARSLLGADVELISATDDVGALATTMERCDAVVNLAGAPLLGGRWTTARRRILEDSRIQVTSSLVQAMALARTRPRVLVSGSAVGYYGDRGDDPLTEVSSAGTDYLAGLCTRWEDAARQAEALGVRVVRLRTSIVLGRAGGALAQMRLPFALGLGGPVGSGRQYVPWIHLHDLVDIVATALVDQRYRGPINGVAPAQATSRSFARAFGRALRRPAVLPVPAVALNAIFGKASTVLLASQRVVPRALETLGFQCAFPHLDAALLDIVTVDAVTIAPVRPRRDDIRAARYELRTRTAVHAPLEQTFAFFSKAANLGLITPASMRFTIQGEVPPITTGTAIRYRLRVGPIPVRWRTRIAAWNPNGSFVDCQETGPYRLWWHEHRFEAHGAITVMEDRVYYAPRFGFLGRLAHRLFIRTMLTEIFQYRRDIIHLRFGTAHATRVVVPHEEAS